MTKRNAKKPQLDIDWRRLLTDPLLQQIVALLLMAMSVITLLGLFRITTGQWVVAWVDRLQYLFGWGSYPVTVAIFLAGLLWLRHHLDRPLKLRWRPLVGAELALFSLLALTHAISGRENPWGLVEQEWGSGLVGWGISILLSTYLGWSVTVLILLALSALGLALTFDLTAADIKRATQAVQRRLAEYAARRQAKQADQAHQPRSQPPTSRRPETRPPTPVTPSRPARPASSPSQPTKPEPSPGTTAPQSPLPSPRRSSSSSSSSSSSTPASGPAERSRSVAFSPSPPRRSRQASLPPISLLNEPEGPPLTDEEIRDKSNTIKKTLGQFNLPVQVTEVRIGPAVTQFGVTPGERGGRKVRVSQISALADDLALALAASRIRIEAPVPGRPVVGIEVPNNEVQVVSLREVMESADFRKLDSPLSICLGHDVAGEPVVADLSRMPHLLIAGTTGSGKSVCIKSIITCLAFNNTPDQLRMVMIDPKMVELVRFSDLPHLYGHVEVDLERIVQVLRWVAWEMDDRYKKFAAAAARNIDDYNHLAQRKGEPSLPRIAVLIDELADLMMLAPDEVERIICRIAQMARATGIHLVVATQRPSTDVVTGLIKANFPARISFATVSQIDSRVILDMPGAETLMGQGDMLFLAADAGYPVRVQGCFVSEEEETRLVDFWQEQVEQEEKGPAPWERVIRSRKQQDQIEEEFDVDPDLLQQAIDLVQETGNASASLLQRKLRIGHPRAARLMAVMEELGIIGPPETGGRTRNVIIGGEE